MAHPIDIGSSSSSTVIPTIKARDHYDLLVQFEQHRLLKGPEFILDSFSHLTEIKGREMIKRTRLVEVKLDDTLHCFLVDYTQKDPVTGISRLVEVPISRLSLG